MLSKAVAPGEVGGGAGSGLGPMTEVSPPVEQEEHVVAQGKGRATATCSFSAGTHQLPNKRPPLLEDEEGQMAKSDKFSAGAWRTHAVDVRSQPPHSISSARR